MGGDGEGNCAGHQSTNEGGVSLLCIRESLWGRGFVEGCVGEGILLLGDCVGGVFSSVCSFSPTLAV